MVTSAKLAIDVLGFNGPVPAYKHTFWKETQRITTGAILSTVLGWWSLLEALLGSAFQPPALPIATMSLGLHLFPYLPCAHKCPLLQCWLGGRVEGMRLHFFTFIIRGCPEALLWPTTGCVVTREQLLALWPSDTMNNFSKIIIIIKHQIFPKARWTKERDDKEHPITSSWWDTHWSSKRRYEPLWPQRSLGKRTSQQLYELTL